LDKDKNAGGSAMVQEGCRVAVVVRASVHSLATNDDVGARRASAACGATRP